MADVSAEEKVSLLAGVPAGHRDEEVCVCTVTGGGVAGASRPARWGLSRRLVVCPAQGDLVPAGTLPGQDASVALPPDLPVCASLLSGPQTGPYRKLRQELRAPTDEVRGRGR